MEKTKRKRDNTQFVSSPLVQPAYDARVVEDISNIRYEKHPPKTPLSHLSSVISFEIPASPNCLTAIQDTLLVTKWRLQKIKNDSTVQDIPEAQLKPIVDETGQDTGEYELDGNTNMVAPEPGAPLCGFQDIYISINDVAIPPSSANLQHYQSYFSFLFDSSNAAKKSTLKQYSLFYPKANGFHDELDARASSGNESLAYLYNRTKGSKLVETISPLVGSPIASFNRALPPNTKIEIAFDRNRPTISALSTDKNDSRHYEFVYASAHLLVKRIELDPPSLTAYNSLLSRSPFTYPFVYRKMSSHMIPSNTLNHEIVIGAQNKPLPTLIRFGLVNKKAFLGTYTQSAFNFVSGGLRSIRLKEADQTISFERELFQPSEKDTDLDSLTLLSTTTPLSLKQWMKRGVMLNEVSYKHGYAILRLDLSRAQIHDEDDDPTIRSSPRPGPVILNLEWPVKTSSPYVLILEEFYDKAIQISKDGSLVQS